MSDNRTCTCHPDDNPPRPCPRKYALHECRDAELTRLRAELERVRAATAEAIIRDCIPGGSVCDPQQVADAIRAWTQEPPA